MLLYLHADNWTFTPVEFPHSDIHGLLDICSSPWLFAAYHVFLRLLVPRHSPYALCSLTFLLRINFVLLCQTSVETPHRTNVLSRRFSFVFLALLVSAVQHLVGSFLKFAFTMLLVCFLVYLVISSIYFSMCYT